MTPDQEYDAYQEYLAMKHEAENPTIRITVDRKHYESLFPPQPTFVKVEGLSRWEKFKRGLTAPDRLAPVPSDKPTNLSDIAFKWFMPLGQESEGAILVGAVWSFCVAAPIAGVLAIFTAPLWIPLVLIKLFQTPAGSAPGGGAIR